MSNVQTPTCTAEVGILPVELTEIPNGNGFSVGIWDMDTLHPPLEADSPSNSCLLAAAPVLRRTSLFYPTFWAVTHDAKAPLPSGQISELSPPRPGCWRSGPSDRAASSAISGACISDEISSAASALDEAERVWRGNRRCATRVATATPVTFARTRET
eukprot:6204115-Pleurochrysis_carterae.AAC.2